MATALIRQAMKHEGANPSRPYDGSFLGILYPFIIYPLKTRYYHYYCCVASTYAAEGINPNVVIVNNSVVNDQLGTWYVGIRQLNKTEWNEYNSGNTPAPPPDFTGRITCNYTLLIYTSGCYWTRPGAQNWSSNGCVVSMLVFLHFKAQHK